MSKRNPRRTDKEWLDMIQECQSSGLSDKCWCQEHHIHTSNFYYQIRRLRQKACEIPEPVHSSFSGKQEVVPLSFEEPAVCPSSVQHKTILIKMECLKFPAIPSAEKINCICIRIEFISIAYDSHKPVF